MTSDLPEQGLTPPGVPSDLVGGTGPRSKFERSSVPAPPWHVYARRHFPSRSTGNRTSRLEWRSTDRARLISRCLETNSAHRFGGSPDACGRVGWVHRHRCAEFGCSRFTERKAGTGQVRGDPAVAMLGDRWVMVRIAIGANRPRQTGPGVHRAGSRRVLGVGSGHPGTRRRQ